MVSQPRYSGVLHGIMNRLNIWALQLIKNHTSSSRSSSKKVNQCNRLIRRLKHFILLKVTITLSNSLVLPLFDYASIIWGDKNNAVLIRASDKVR